ncbi:MAG: hypothetical protein M0Q21_12410 [Ignavibacteriaceae bacterium]|nr:hypothetical protein [Ignavibacteriaceae bacterium]
MAKIQKFVLPLLACVTLLTIYIFYFSSAKGLGSFKDYDPYSHAQKEIVVKLLSERGIEKIENGQKTLFYVEDRQGTQLPIQTEKSLPDGFENSETIKLTGHICGGSYELINIEID